MSACILDELVVPRVPTQQDVNTLWSNSLIEWLCEYRTYFLLNEKEAVNRPTTFDNLFFVRIVYCTVLLEQ